MTTAGEASAFGVFRVGDRLVGVPIANLAEVCTVMSLSALMTAQGPVLGAFNLRGGLVPLVDIEALAGAGSYDRPARRAAVLRYADRFLAIAVDEVVRLFEAQPVQTNYGPQSGSEGQGAIPPFDSSLFPEGFVMDDKVVSCLSARALFESDTVLSVPKTDRSKEKAETRHCSKYLVLSAGGVTIAVDIKYIWATFPKQRLEELDISSDADLFLGFTKQIGWRIPVVDTNRVLGIGQATSPRETEVVVLHMPNDRLIGFHVDATERLSAFAQDEQQDSNRLIGQGGLLPKVV
ncbi:MAG: chemotaxis protein CheW, partial [Pseudomonadota bacterium]